MHTAAQKFRKKLADGQPVLGTFLVEFQGSAVVHVLADAGFDFVLIDCEHGNHGPRDIELMIEAAYHAGICALVRPPTVSREMITRVLDAGAAGVLLPAIESMEQVEQAVRSAKYRPLGKRGVHLLRGHTRHRPVDATSFLREANEDTLTFVQIELERAVEIVDQIAATAGVDGLYVGPGDLSVDLGVPGQWNSASVQSAIAKVAKACRTHGKIMACHADRVENMPRLREMGVQVFGYFCDIGLFKAAAAGVVADFRTTLGKPGASAGSPSK
jgi:4-hydroxy-2-oxoheptanedioate aldolase